MNPRQAAAVGCAFRGALLVLAGAGSGKTTVLTRRVAYLLESFPESGILALTFTTEAAREMEARLRALMGNAPGAGETASRASMPTIGTFHAFALALIRSRFPQSSGGAFHGAPNWALLGFKSSPSLVDPAGVAAWLKREKKASGLEAPLEMLEEWIRNPFAATAPGPESFGSEYRRLEMRKKFRHYLLETGCMAFDDMVCLAIRLLREHPALREEVRARYRHILVDEFQDTSREQLELVKLLAGEDPSLFLVGDDDQAIYGFRGADPGNIDAALGHFPGMGIIKLETNYRSSAAIVAYANAIFGDKPEALRKRLLAGSSRGAAPVRVMAHRNGLDQARWMVAEMRRLRGEEGLAWGDMAILFRLNALEPYYRSLLRRLAGEDAAREVVLGTVHAAKGLEYPAVFFAGLEDGILPYRRGKAPLSPDRLAEERRIFYVGVTRAQRFLYLCSCRTRVLRGKTLEAEASPFLRTGRGMGFRGAMAGRVFLRKAAGLWGALRAEMRSSRARKGE